MFAHDYLELRGIVDPERYLHGLDRFLARREGLMGVAFRPRSAAATYEKARAAGIEATAPRELTRRFELPEGDAHPRFRLVFFPDATTHGLMASLACEHLTPELIRRPEWLEHANGALAVQAIGSVVADLELVEAQQRLLFGPDAVHRSDGRVRVDAGGGATLDFLGRIEAARAGVALPGIEPPYLASLTIRVSATAKVSSVLVENEVPHLRIEGLGVRVAAAEACGTVLTFLDS
jgi:hypothetical protein